MIDIEVKVFNELYGVVPNGTTIKSIPDYTPTTFPTVEFSMQDCYDNIDTQNSTSNENYVNVMFALTVYTKGSTRKKDAKTLFATLDSKLHDIGLTRQSYVGYAYANDTFRIDARYSAVASSSTIYRR